LQSTCHIFIDQLSGLGYGLSGLQAIAMGIPTLVNLKKEHEEFLGDHPFVNFDETNLEEKLIELVENRELREKLGKKGIEWVKRVHDPMKATKTMVDEYRNLGWV
ncbi:MAG: glycosyltransferase, partial [bacterium]